MASIVVLPLTEKARVHFWLLGQADGAVGPGGSDGGRHLEDVIHAVHTNRNTFHQPLHGGCGDPVERAAALQRLLQGTGGMEQCSGYCGEGGSGVGKAS